MDRTRISTRARRIARQRQPRPLTPQGDWHGRCTRCGEVVSGTVAQIIAKHARCRPPARGWWERLWRWIGF